MGPIVVDDDNKGAAHVLVIPFINQGHVTPMLRLATQLCRRGVTITFSSTEESIAGLTSPTDGGSSSELEGLDFRFVALPQPEGEYESVRDGSTFMSQRLNEFFKPLTEKLIRDKKAGIAGPTSLISDVFLPWTQDLADRLQIPRYILITEGTIFARFVQGLLPYFETGKFEISETDDRIVPFDWLVSVSGLPPLHFYQLPRSLREEPLEYRCRCESFGRAAGVLVNSFLELEEKVIENWRSVGHPGFEHIKVPKIYPVGPLFSTSDLDVRGPPCGLEDLASKCLQWLDSQPSSSVLYVAFGSLFRLAPEQIHELALGLEDSEQRFLLVVPQLKGRSDVETPSSLMEVLPQGFEARLGDRACIVTGWAPQLQILAHSSTGAFFTHSGWNSSLESITLGVPMISWPQGAEQYLNCGYVVDDLKIALELRTGPEKIVKRKEVERVVRLLMVESEGKTIRSRIGELHRKAEAAVADGGSKSRFYLELLDDLSKHERSSGSGRKQNLSAMDSKVQYMQESPEWSNWSAEGETR